MHPPPLGKKGRRLLFLLGTHNLVLLLRLLWIHGRIMSSASAVAAVLTAGGWTPPPHVVIVGAGVVGTSTAYYLAKDHASVRRMTLVDITGQVAPAASGKAGGFLALDWNDRTPTQALTRRSFALHQTLADTLGAETLQYRRLCCAAVTVGDSTPRRPAGRKFQTLEWAATADRTQATQVLGDEATIAQVHPHKLCSALWEATQQAAPESRLIQGRVVRTLWAEKEDGTTLVQGVALEDGTTIQADAVLYATGPWTTHVPLQGIKYHSAVVPTDRVLTQCVFFTGKYGDPEVYVRPDATAYCTGFPDDPVTVTERPGQEQVREESIQRILHAVQESSGNEGLGTILSTHSENTAPDEESSSPIVKQSCYLPSTPDGIPVMGRLDDGSYLAAGHGCWGILLGPASGEAMASLIATGKSTTVDLSPFDPARFRR